MKKIYQYYGFWWHICESTPAIKKKLDICNKTLELERKIKKAGYNVVNGWIFESIINNDALAKNSLLCSYFMHIILRQF